MKGLNEFLDEAADDDGLRAEIAAAKKGPAAKRVDAVVEIGRRHGYVFTAEDLEDFAAESAALAVKNTSLTDEQLEAVAGGKGGALAGALLSLFAPKECP